MDLMGEAPSGEVECHGVSKQLTWWLIDSPQLLKSALSSGDFGLVTFRVYNDSMLFWRQHSPSDPMLGVGCAIVVGYDDANQWFILRTTRGADWGDDGYCYYPYTDWGYHSYCLATSGERESEPRAGCCGCGVV